MPVLNHEIVFSVMIPVRNLQDRLKQVLPVLLRELEAHPQWELVLGDDHSEDGTPRLLEQQSHPRVQTFLADAHLGRGALRNRLAELANGQWLVFLDGDCIPQPGWMDAWEKAVQKDESSSWVGTVLYENCGKSGLGRFLSRASGPSRFKTQDLFDCSYFTTGNSMVKAHDFRRVGGFPEDFRGWGGEDFDLGLRLQKSGVTLRHQPASVVLHPRIQNVGSYFDRLEHFGAENLWHLVESYPDHRPIFHIHQLSSRFVLRWGAVLVGPMLRGLLTKTDFFPWPSFLYRGAIFSSFAKGFLNTARRTLRELPR